MLQEWLTRVNTLAPGQLTLKDPALSCFPTAPKNQRAGLKAWQQVLAAFGLQLELYHHGLRYVRYLRP